MIDRPVYENKAFYFSNRYVKDMMPYSDKRARAILVEYNRVLTGKETEPPRLKFLGVGVLVCRSVPGKCLPFFDIEVW